MTNLIYQVWVGDTRPGVDYSIENIKNYADRIGADYYFDHNPTYGQRMSGVSKGYYDWMNPIFQKKYDKYDTIAVLDCDIYAPDNMNDNIFDVEIKDFGICTEPMQPKFRAINPNARIGKNADEKWSKVVKKVWGIDLPRDEDNLLKVYNAGMVLFSKQGRIKARENFVPFKEYIQKIRQFGMDRFYWLDQNYFHSMMVGFSDYTEIDNDWNALLHYHGTRDKNAKGPAYGREVNDPRNENTKLVHVQLSEADHYNSNVLYRIINLPQNEWKF